MEGYSTEETSSHARTPRYGHSEMSAILPAGAHERSRSASYSYNELANDYEVYESNKLRPSPNYL